MPLSSNTGESNFGAQPYSSTADPGDPDYARENELALARIEAGAPELAGPIQTAYDNRTEHSAGIISGIWNTVTSPVRKVIQGFDAIASATAEPFQNEEGGLVGEGGEDVKVGKADPFYTDIMQGLRGQEHTRWKDNLVSYGAPEDHWMTTVGGLAGDVFIDPTNYIGLGGLGVGRDTLALGAKELGQHAALGMVKEKIAREGGLMISGKGGQRWVTEADDIAKIVREEGAEAFTKLGVHENFVDALAGTAAANAEDHVFRGVHDLAEMKAKWIGEYLSTRVLQQKSIRMMGKKPIVDPWGQKWDPQELIDVFTKTSRLNPKQLSALATDMFKGNLSAKQLSKLSPEDIKKAVGPGSSGFLGRKAAGALGGVRIKFGIPFSERLGNKFDTPWLGYRWQSGSIPIAGRTNIFGVDPGLIPNEIGNFTRGISGINRLDAAIQTSLQQGDDVWQQGDMEQFLRRGFSGFEAHMANSGRHQQFRQLFGDKGVSGFMTASDKMGDFTAHFTRGAQLTRRLGHVGLEAKNEIRQAGVSRKLFTNIADRNTMDWQKAEKQLDVDIQKGIVDGDAVNDASTKYLEGLGDNFLDQVPEYMRKPLKEMKERYPLMLDEAKKLGVDVGNMAEVFARRRSDVVLKLARRNIGKYAKQLEAAQAEGRQAMEQLDTEVGGRAASMASAPAVDAAQAKIDEMKQLINKTLTEQKTLELEMAQMDEYDRLIGTLRGVGPGFKTGPKAYFHRRLTPEAKNAIVMAIQGGRKGKKWRQAKDVSAQLERLLAHKTLAEAEEYLRMKHPEAFKNIKNIWEKNTFRTFAAYKNDMGEAVYKSQLGSAADHVMAAFGNLDNSAVMRTTAYLPKEFFPNSIKAENAKKAGIVSKSFTSLHAVLDEVSIAVGAKVHKTAHAEGSARWAGRSKESGKNMETWRDAPAGKAEGGKLSIHQRTMHESAQSAEYLDIDDLDDLANPGNVALANQEAKMYKATPEATAAKARSRMKEIQDDLKARNIRALDVPDDVEAELQRLAAEIMQADHAIAKRAASGGDVFDPDAMKNAVKAGQTGAKGYSGFETYEEFLDDVRKNGWKEPLALGYDPTTGGVVVLNGHHRLKAARELAQEDDVFRYVPTYVQREPELPVAIGNSFGYQDVIDEAHKAGTLLDWEKLDTVPNVMRPSDLYNIESGRLGRVEGRKFTPTEAQNIENATRELNKARARSQGMSATAEVAFKKINRSFDARGWGKVDIPGFEDFVMHPFLAAEFNQALKGVGGPNELQKHWRQFVLNPWKKAATIYFPGFHVRNAMGAYFNNFLGGVQMRHYGEAHEIMNIMRASSKGKVHPDAGKIWKTNIRIDGQFRAKVTYGEVADMMHAHGVTSVNSLAMADFGHLLKPNKRRALSSKLSIGPVFKMQSKTMGQVTWAEGFLNKWEDVGVATTNTTENFFRGAAFLKGLEDAAGDSAAARNFVMMRHGDYEDLTDWENNIRDVVPFYKWMRTNIPYQIQQLLENPAKQEAFMDLENAFLDDDKKKNLSSYLQKEMHIPIPKGIAKILGSEDGPGYLAVQLPMHDLMMSANEFGSSFLPVARQIILERGLYKKDLYTGAPLEGTTSKPVAGWMQGPIGAILSKIPQEDGKPIVEAGGDGKYYMTDRGQNFMSLLPIFARSRAFMVDDEDRKKARFAAFLSATAGVRPEELGKDALNDGEREWYYNTLLPEVEKLQSVGYKLPTATDLGLAGNSGGGKPAWSTM